jgi:NAD(P)H dehydrogenase (quinone)
MNVSLILAHPSPASFNHAIATTVADRVREHGHTICFHDLYVERFDPVATASELARDAVLPPAIERHCCEIGEADAIVVIHPNWWSDPPAILRGWVDRVLRPGRAYNFVPDGSGGAHPVGLLKARTALVFNTANTPQDKEESLFGDPLQTHWVKVVFGLCGVPTVVRRNFTPVITSTAAQRTEWLAQVATLIDAHLGRTA